MKPHPEPQSVDTLLVLKAATAASLGPASGSVVASETGVPLLGDPGQRLESL